jgi:hypothetical protein
MDLDIDSRRWGLLVSLRRKALRAYYCAIDLPRQRSCETFDLKGVEWMRRMRLSHRLGWRILRRRRQGSRRTEKRVSDSPRIALDQRALKYLIPSRTSCRQLPSKRFRVQIPYIAKIVTSQQVEGVEMSLINVQLQRAHVHQCCGTPALS